MLINHSDRVLGDPDGLYCKSQEGGTSATLDQTGKPQYLRQRSCSQPTSVSLGGPAVSQNRALIVDRKICQSVRVNPGSTGKLSTRSQRFQAPLSDKSKSQPIEPMETKTQTTHTVTIGRVEIGGGRIVATCQTSGDTVILEVPYGAVTEAVEKYLTDRLTRWDRDRIITMLTDLNREADAKAEAK